MDQDEIRPGDDLVDKIGIGNRIVRLRKMPPAVAGTALVDPGDVRVDQHDVAQSRRRRRNASHANLPVRRCDGCAHAFPIVRLGPCHSLAVCASARRSVQRIGARLVCR